MRVLQLAIVDDEKIQGGKQAITRSYRDANGSDPGRIKRVEWNVWGPIGDSLQSGSNGLNTDFAQNLETRWPRRLISAGAAVTVPLAGMDPPGTGAYYGVPYYYGTSYYGSPDSSGQPVTVFDEQGGYLFAHRGPVSTQVSYATWSVIASVVQNAPVLDAAFWRGQGRIALGSSVPMQSRTSVGAAGCTYADTVSTSPSASVYANAVKRGSDRAWIIDAAVGATQNFLGYTLDGFVTMAAPFQVGDPDVGLTGIGPYGPFTMVGANDNIGSFTDQGKPVPLSRALLNHNSPMNGQQWADPGFGWNYYLSAIGLRATNGSDDNPVGIGERMREFTGHSGVPVAIFAERGELWVAYNDAGNIYMYRCAFSKVARGAEEQALNFGQSPFYSQTRETGQPDLYPFHYFPAAEVTAFFASTVPTKPVVMWGYGTDMMYQVIAANGRDDLDVAYPYSTGGGTWYGTTLDANFNLLKTLRIARFHTRSMTLGSSWSLAFAFDPSPVGTLTATYTAIATVTSDGYHVVTPVSGGVPITSISGRTMKPRLIQVAGGSGASVNPPEVNGTLEVEYDERPDQIEEVDVAINVTATGYSSNYIWDILRQLVGSSTAGPLKIQLPSDQPPGVAVASGGGQVYAMVASVANRQDIKDNSIESINLKLHVWPEAEALG